MEGQSSKKQCTHFTFDNQYQKYDKRGFTLLEILFTTFLIGTLSTIAIPNIQRTMATAKDQTLRQMLRKVHLETERVYMSLGHYPEEGNLSAVPAGLLIQSPMQNSGVSSLDYLKELVERVRNGDYYVDQIDYQMPEPGRYVFTIKRMHGFPTLYITSEGINTGPPGDLVVTGNFGGAVGNNDGQLSFASAALNP